MEECEHDYIGCPDGTIACSKCFKTKEDDMTRLLKTENPFTLSLTIAEIEMIIKMYVPIIYDQDIQDLIENLTVQSDIKWQQEHGELKEAPESLVRRAQGLMKEKRTQRGEK